MRKSWEDYFLDIAEEVATRATCDRKHVGAVFVKDRNILCTGYNGSMRGMPHCDDVGHIMENGHCIAVIHAEINAIAQAAKHGVALEGSDCYVTCSPCWNCFKTLVNSGVHRIYYREFYRDERIFEAARKTNTLLCHLPKVSNESSGRVSKESVPVANS